MRIISASPVPGGLLNQEFLVTVEHTPGRLRRLFGANPWRRDYRGAACWWYIAETGESINAHDHWPGPDYSAKELLTNWYQRWRWAVQDSDAARVVPPRAATHLP